jgi:hypothetical protein
MSTLTSKKLIKADDVGKLVGLLTVALFAACGGRGTLYTSPLKPLPILATSSAVVSVVPQTNRAVILRPDVKTPTALRLTPGARLAKRIPRADALVVLTGGPRDPTVDLVDLAANEVQVLDLPGFFDGVSFSDDGRFGVFTYDAASTAGPLVARNLNEVGLLTVGSRTITRLQLDTESLAPRGVLFGPSEPNRQLVAVTLERGVAIFDALHPDTAPRRITIRPPGSSSESSVVQAVFSRDAHWLFLRASALDDVIAIELGPEVGQPPSASINFVSGGRGLTDLEASPDGFPDSVLAVYATSRELWLLDARGIQDNAKRLASPEAISTVSVLGGSRVLAWDDRGSKGVVAWDLADGRSGSSVLDGTTGAATLVPAMGKALFFHATTAAGGPSLSTVTVADETNRLRLRLQSIQLSRSVQASAIDDASQRLFFAVNASSSVVTLELSTLRLAEMPLDTPTTTLLYLPDNDTLASVNTASDRLGDVTLWPAGQIERTAAIRFTDFIFTGDLDRAEAP